MVEHTLMDLDEIRAQLDELAQQARAISENGITMSKPRPIRALTGTTRSRRRGKAERPHLIDG
jgi:hypothetical protein